VIGVVETAKGCFLLVLAWVKTVIKTIIFHPAPATPQPKIVSRKA
jgi:hypothetical protein